MKKLIRLTESELHRIVKESVNRILQEDGEIGGGGATNCVGINVGGAGGQAKNHIDAPAFGGKNKKKVGGNAFSEPIMRQKHNLGDVTQAKVNQVDMKPALKRGGSIAMGENLERKINEVVDEGIGNWLKGAAIGGMMAMSPMQSNAQNVQPQSNDSTQTSVMQKQGQQMTVQDLMKKFPRAYKDRNANPKVWEKHQKAYVAEVNGKISLVGKIAASHGQNPWNALLKAYCPNSPEHIFNFGDFDIQ